MSDRPPAPAERPRPKVFLAGIIQGSLVEPAIHNQDWRGEVRRVLDRHLPGADVYCHYSEHPASITYGQSAIEATLAEGIRRAAACDVLVAYLPSASMGTAIEMYEAARHAAVVLTVSPLAANWVVRAYSDERFADLDAFERFLASGGLASRMASKRRPAR